MNERFLKRDQCKVRQSLRQLALSQESHVLAPSSRSAREKDSTAELEVILSFECWLSCGLHSVSAMAGSRQGILILLSNSY